MTSSESGVPGDRDQDDQRQRVVRVPGRRRARLTPAPGAGPDPAVDDAGEEPAASDGEGPNDERMRREVPPHY